MSISRPARDYDPKDEGLAHSDKEADEWCCGFFDNTLTLTSSSKPSESEQVPEKASERLIEK